MPRVPSGPSGRLSRLGHDPITRRPCECSRAEEGAAATVAAPGRRFPAPVPRFPAASGSPQHGLRNGRGHMEFDCALVGPDRSGAVGFGDLPQLHDLFRLARGAGGGLR